MGDHSYAYLIEAARMQANILAAINASTEVDKIDNAQLDDIAWAKVLKAGSSLADLATKSAAALDSGDLAAARMSVNIVAALNSLDLTLSSVAYDTANIAYRNVTNDYVRIYGGTADSSEGAFLQFLGRNFSTTWGGSGLIDLCYDPTYGNNPWFKIRLHNVIAATFTDIFFINRTGDITISGVYDDTVAGTANVIVSAGGHLQRATSNEKHKKNIKDLTLDTSKIYDLKPREFQWDHEIEELRETETDEEGEIKEGKVIRPKQIVTKDHVGLIAEEVPEEFATHNILTGEADGIEWNAIVTALLSEVKKLREEVNILKRK